MEKLGPVEKVNGIVVSVGGVAFNALTYAIHQMHGGAWGQLGEGFEPKLTEEQIKQAEAL